ncbi:MAG: glucose-1-phosphate cytidylyltransferase [Bacteroidia bacterium]|jgi:glucose-1-phosphate cytidylyltransferase
MKVVILAGGFGTRLSEETVIKPKPMVEIGEQPILWHIMKTYANYGFNEFVILVGYKGQYIKDYFLNYHNRHNDFSINLKTNQLNTIRKNTEDWNVSLIDTGENTMTGGRIKRVQELIGNNQFLLTYGDGLSDINIPELIEYHNKHKGYVTMSAIQPEGRFGSLAIGDNGCINSFKEKPKGDGSWVNGGYFVCDPEVFNFIDGDDSIFERSPLELLAKEGRLFSKKHYGFWKCMDNINDKNNLNEMWKNNSARWKTW